jgi:hypothetical protein
VDLERSKRSSLPPVEPTATHYTRAFVSLARLQLACSFDLALGSVNCLPLQAGRAADKRTLLWARKQGLPWCEALCEGAAVVGRLHMLVWLHSEQQCPWAAQVIRVALRRCDLPMLQALSRLALPDAMNTLCTEYMQELVDSPLAGCIITLSWLHNAGCVDLNEPNNQQLVAEAAIVGGHASTLQWLFSKHYSLDENEILYGNDEVCPSSLAVRNGHLDMLKLLHSHLDMLKLLHSEGLELVLDISTEAARSGCIAVMRYLVEHSIGGPEHPTNIANVCLDIAGYHGHVDMMHYLKQHGAQWPQQLWERSDDRLAPHDDDFQAACWALPALQWAVTVGCPLGEWPVGLYSELIACNYSAEVSWLHTLSTSPCGDSCTAKQQQQQQRR